MEEIAARRASAGEPVGDIHPEHERGVIDALVTRICDLTTIVDFCNEAAGVGAVEVIRDAHDIMHVLTGGDRTREWGWMNDWLGLLSPRNKTPAWLDVRFRMRAVYLRAGGELAREA